MKVKNAQIREILKSLIPKNQEELSVLRLVLYCAERIQKIAHSDLSLSQTYDIPRDNDTPEISLDPRAFFETIPEESKRYFHGLVEALEIYRSIHGVGIPIQNLGLSDRSVYKLKQIRDMCLEEGLRSIY